MRKYLFRIENLLLLFPLLLLCSPVVFFNNNALDIHLHDTYIVLDVFYIIIGLFIFQLLPYFLHAVLRWKRKRNGVICAIHVLLTIILILLVFALFFMVISEPVANDISIDKVFNTFGNDSKTIKAISYIFLCLVLLRAFFIIYFGFAYWRNAKNEKAR